MAIVYTLSWETNLSVSNDSREFGKIAYVVATAGETLDEFNVLGARHVTTNALLPQLNTPSSTDPRYYVQRVSAPRFDGPRAAEVAISYRLGKGSGEQEEEDPLSVPLRYRVRNGVSGEPTDSDVNGKPLVNSAGDPFSGTVNTNISALYIDVVRNEGAYDLNRAYQFTNTINGDGFVLAGYAIRPGEAYCLGIEPEREFKLNDPYVPVVYSFELRPLRTLANGNEANQFIHRLLDQGQRAWGYGSGGGDYELAQIHHKAGDGTDITPVSSDVLLSGDGTPLDQSGYVTTNPNFDQEDNKGWEPQVGGNDKAPNAERDVDANTGATFLLYQKFKTSNFSELGLS